MLQDALFRVHRNVWISGRKLAKSKAGLFFWDTATSDFYTSCQLKQCLFFYVDFRKIVGSRGTGVLILVLPDADKDHYLFGKKSVTVALKRIWLFEERNHCCCSFFLLEIHCPWCLAPFPRRFIGRRTTPDRLLLWGRDRKSFSKSRRGKRKKNPGCFGDSPHFRRKVNIP